MEKEELKGTRKRKNIDDYEEAIIVEDKKKSNAGGIIAFIIGLLFVIFVIVACLAVLLWGIKSGKLEKFVSKFKSNEIQEVVEIKHTETTTVKSEGVYITDVSEVVDEVMPSIVAITSKTVVNSGIYAYFYGGSYTATGAGSGVIISEDNDNIYIVTNYHIVENTTELIVKFIDDKTAEATIRGTSENKDVAVVAVKKSSIDNDTLEKIKIITVGSSDALKVGNGVIAIGNALGYGQSVTVGVVSALNREIVGDSNPQPMIQMDAPINGGNSGGALLNSKGELVGINSAKYSANATSSSSSIEGMCFAIPISDVEEIIKELIKGNNDESGVLLGIEGAMTSQISIQGKDNAPDGFYISAIASGSNADNSDLQVGDIITHVEGEKVTSVETIRKALSKKKKGDSIKLTIQYADRKEYKTKDITVKLN